MPLLPITIIDALCPPRAELLTLPFSPLLCVCVTAALRYYGTGECFVFSANEESTRVSVHRWSRKNSFFQLSAHGFLAVGGGGHFALWIDDDLAFGSTAECSTFDSAPLTVSRADACRKVDDEGHVEFEIVTMEVWAPVIRRHVPGRGD
jgi:hypothetical protein